jgi:hypothetical protein
MPMLVENLSYKLVLLSSLPGHLPFLWLSMMRLTALYGSGA